MAKILRNKSAGLASIPFDAPSGSAPAFGLWDQHRSNLVDAARAWAAALGDVSSGEEEGIAQSVCAELVRRLWDVRTDKSRIGFSPWPWRMTRPPLHLGQLAGEAARSLAGFSIIEAAYLVSTLYTALLPANLRAERGAFYTPPVLAERLLDLASSEGTDWSTATVLDPACGGGAFLVPVAHRILNDHRVRCLGAAERLDLLAERLAGIEIDEFAAWMSRIFLQILAFPLSEEVGRPLRVPIRTADTLDLASRERRQFDLVIGNPPYGRIGLPPEQRLLFSRSLFGHANLYGVFLDAALRWRKPTGLVAFVTPTSFLGGQYFSRLRNLLLQEAPPLVIDVVEERTGVFDLVQQETCLAVFGPNQNRTTVVHLLQISDRTVRANRAGTFSLKEAFGVPWFLPRSPRQARLASRAGTLKTRLHHLGYKASTGPLVWNRHKSQLRSHFHDHAYPLVWAEAVRPNCFSFEYRSRAHSPYFAVLKDQDHLLDAAPCVLVQRTTAKEQDRRLVACAVPADFLEEWEKIVIENHVNVLRAVGGDPVDPAALAAVLNTSTVDQVFRCLSGTVAVSASELHALPLPPREVFEKVSVLLAKQPAREGLSIEAQEAVESLVARAYGH